MPAALRDRNQSAAADRVFDCQLIVGPYADGAWNMALDEALLESADRDGRIYLRFYQWREPTLSLGYFQSYSARDSHPASAGCPIVRRATGGGAILHDRELTYSIALPLEHPVARQTEALYLAVHHSLVDTLATIGVPARCREPIPNTAVPTSAASPEPFLCFQRATFGDVLIDSQAGLVSQSASHKVAGSAQRRRRRAVLQHGSILLQESRFAPKLPGIVDLTGVNLTADCLLEIWSRRLANALQLRTESSSVGVAVVGSTAGAPTKNPPPAILAAAEQIRAAKFAHPDWTGKR